MNSRLDRLFILLDTGSNDSIRLAAAKQLGEVQRVQPNERDYLLQRIKEYSSKSVWETRTAAGHATRCVLEHVGTWADSENQEAGDDKASCMRDIVEKEVKQNANAELILTHFDLDSIVSSCPKLLSLDNIDDDQVELASPTSSRTTTRGRGRGKKEATSKNTSRKSDKEQLLRQRKLINKELGIAMVDSLNLGVKSTDIVSNDDLQPEYETNFATSMPSSNQLQEERSILQKSVSNYEKVVEKLEKENCIVSQGEEVENCDIKAKLEWPLANITKQYAHDLFSPSWETRHGAAIALREIVKLQGGYAGRWIGFSKTTNNLLNQLYLTDMALKALSVLALDKFGDFLFDQVVAPVRENAAQLLGCCLAHMTQPNASATIKIILNMLKSPNWETRHGGILGLKYYLNIADKSFTKQLLHDCFEPITKCLNDPVDDVSAEAAAALVPVIEQIIETLPDRTTNLVKFLWDHLAELDELTTSTSNIVLLLASLVTSSSTQLDASELIKSIPRFWSLLSHSSTSVRNSVLKALITLLKSQKSTCLSWMPENLMSTALRLIFQRAILEGMEEVHHFIEEAWMLLIKIDEESLDASNQRLNLLKSTSQFLNSWLCFIMQPINIPIDRGSSLWLNIKPDGTASNIKPEGEVYIGSSTFDAETMEQQRQQVTKCRLLAARLLGALYANLINDFGETAESQYAKDTLKYVSDTFNYYIKTKSANQRMISGWTVESWANHQSNLLKQDSEKLKSILPKPLIETLNLAIQETNLCYDELAPTFTRLQQEARSFVFALREANINIDQPVTNDKRVIYTLNQIQSFCELDIESELTKLIAKRTQKTSKAFTDQETTRCETSDSLNSKKSNLIKCQKVTICSQKSLSTAVLSSLAYALISWRHLPNKISLATQPLLNSIEFEAEQSLQDTSIKYLVTLIDILTQNLEENNDQIKSIINQLIDMITPPSSLREITGELSSVRDHTDPGKRNNPEIYKIILLDNLQRRAEQNRVLSRRQSSINSTASLKRSHSLASSIDLDNESSTIPDEQTRPQQVQSDSNNIKIRGASSALGRLVKHFGIDLPVKASFLWTRITTDIKSLVNDHMKSDSTGSDNDLIRNLQLLHIVGECIDISLRRDLLNLFQDLICLLRSLNPSVRHYSAQCIGIISKLMLSDTVGLINSNIIGLLEQSEDIVARCGAIEAIALIIEHLQLDLAPRINMFIIHVLRRMSDQNDQIRLMSTHCFGKLLILMPLNLEKSKEVCGIDTEQKFSEDDSNKSFIEQLLNPKKLENFVMPFKIDAQLRSYQQDGLNWLAFLNRFNLHGILCDEMGLGKTLMTICIVASDHFLCKSKGDSQATQTGPSLIICPSTLTEHWLYEVNKFLPDNMKEELNPVTYSGPLNERMSLRCYIMNATVSRSKDNKLSDIQSVKPVNLVIASYDIVRNDIDFFKDIQWNYCVLDEGHIIKNGKTKLSRAIRLLNAQHRLILSGTPIQNNVTELWSLFDFLMPGFLGSERQFNSRYARPILQSREMKCSTRDLEAGALAMESLHRQVLPFTLRRLKEDVLDDLPPKILQDYYCELSPLQHKLYEDFTRSKLCQDGTKQSIENLKEDSDLASDIKNNAKSHVFQALQYLKNVCNHPKLVLTTKHSQYNEVKKSLENQKSNLDDISHSSKLKALKQLLIDCGIGTSSQLFEDQQQNLTSIQSVVNQHRALIFCQIRSMVDIIENDLLKKHLPTVTYLKLDGSVPVKNRQTIVSRFNNDPSIDILLLTTQIGGLGLNLTGADTVIFVEHDWNPTKDLQAMDRAHRIGQKKVVNVYRLITKGTLEEKIMGLQKFKTMVSNTVINQDNSGLETMNVDQLFDLFEDKVCDNNSSDVGRQSDSGGSRKLKSSAVIDLLPELWDQQQYETEYDLSSFVSSLKK